VIAAIAERELNDIFQLTIGGHTVKTLFNVRGSPRVEKGRSKASVPRDAAIIQMQI
jgi:hypothetical protein